MLHQCHNRCSVLLLKQETWRVWRDWVNTFYLCLKLNFFFAYSDVLVKPGCLPEGQERSYFVVVYSMLSIRISFYGVEFHVLFP